MAINACTNMSTRPYFFIMKVFNLQSDKMVMLYLLFLVKVQSPELQQMRSSTAME
jgi:hypothetical protein